MPEDKPAKPKPAKLREGWRPLKKGYQASIAGLDPADRTLPPGTGTQIGPTGWEAHDGIDDAKTKPPSGNIAPEAARGWGGDGGDDDAGGKPPR